MVLVGKCLLLLFVPPDLAKLEFQKTHPPPNPHPKTNHQKNTHVALTFSPLWVNPRLCVCCYMKQPLEWKWMNRMVLQFKMKRAIFSREVEAANLIP